MSTQEFEWGIDGYNTHGIEDLASAGLYEPPGDGIGGIGPDDIFWGTPAQLAAHLWDEGYRELEMPEGEEGTAEAEAAFKRLGGTLSRETE